MIIIGIDPGFRITGYSVISFHLSKLTCLESGIIDLRKINNKLGYLYSALDTLGIKYKPNYIVIEKIIAAKNSLSTIKLAQIAGVCICYANNNNISVAEYFPKYIKKLITSDGSSDKLQVLSSIASFFRISQQVTLDEIDAYSVALCHLKILLTQQDITFSSLKQHSEQLFLIGTESQTALIYYIMSISAAPKYFALSEDRNYLYGFETRSDRKVFWLLRKEGVPIKASLYLSHPLPPKRYLKRYKEELQKVKHLDCIH